MYQFNGQLSLLKYRNGFTTYNIDILEINIALAISVCFCFLKIFTDGKKLIDEIT